MLDQRRHSESERATGGGYLIDSARRVDAAAIRGICVATCWMGSYRPEIMLDEEIWADYWTRWFIQRERHLSWVVRRATDGQVVGYLTGTADERRFHRYVPWLVPGFALRGVAATDRGAAGGSGGRFGRRYAP